MKVEDWDEDQFSGGTRVLCHAVSLTGPKTEKTPPLIRGSLTLKRPPSNQRSWSSSCS
ncbi:MAG: hypothetical protein AAF664_06830 [Planctomycetota bacterium]